MAMDKRRTWADWSMVVFYSLIAASGAISFVVSYPDGVDTGPEILTYLLISVGFILFGLLGVVARVSAARRAELIVICSISGLLLTQAVLTFHLTGLSGLAVITRLLAAPWLMVPYGLLRQRTVISKRDIAAVKRALEHPFHD